MADQNFPSASEPVKNIVSEPIKNIVLVGRTGNGKSATGNTLLGREWFTSKKQAGGVTVGCEMFRAVTQDGHVINVIDTPGLFDLSIPSHSISKEIFNCLRLAEEGIHAVLLVLTVKTRISEEEESTLNSLQRIFDSKILNYVIVVFTGGDELEKDGQTLDDYLSGGFPEYLKRVLQLCGGRKILLDNKTTDNDKKSKQLKELMDLIADVGTQTRGIPYGYNIYRRIKEEMLKELQDSNENKMSDLEKMVEDMLKRTSAQEKNILDHQIEQEIMMMMIKLGIIAAPTAVALGCSIL